MFSAVGGAHLFILLAGWLIALAIIGLVVYFVVRLAVLHALKAHTRWVDGGKP